VGERGSEGDVGAWTARASAEVLTQIFDEGRRKADQAFASACDEGNHALTSMLAGARAREREGRRGDRSRR
jgi:hypothetical protein